MGFVKTIKMVSWLEGRIQVDLYRLKLPIGVKRVC